MALDMTTIARFLVLPGAEELVEAFSRIPPGALRDSVVSHAQVIAETYRAAPASQQMPDPLLMASSSPAAVARAISGPRVGEIKVDEPETKAVQLRLQGRTPAECAEETGLTLLQVHAAFKRAKAHGVTLPPLPKGQPMSAEPTRRYIMFMTELEDDARSAGVMRKAAERLGLTLKQYVNRRRKLVELRMKNTPMDAIARALHPIPEKTLWNWITMARRAHIDIPASLEGEGRVTFEAIEPSEPIARDDGPRYDLAEDGEDDDTVIVEPIPAAPSDGKKSVDTARPQTGVWPVPYDQMHWMEQKSVRAAAKGEGKSTDEIIARHKLITDELLAGRYPVQIEEDHGVAGHFIQATIRAAERYGVTLPPRKRGAAASKAMGRPLHIDKLVAAKAKRRQPEAEPEPFAGFISEPVRVAPADEPEPAPERTTNLNFWTDPAELYGAHLLQATNAAARLGLDLEAYAALRRRALELFGQGLSHADVAQELGLDKKQVESWRDNAKAAGLLSSDSRVTFPLFEDELSAGGRVQLAKTAEKLGATLEGYMALRRSAVAMFIRGVKPVQVAEELGLDAKMISNWNFLSRAAGRQVTGSPVPPEAPQDPAPALQDQASEAAPRAAAAPEPPAPHAPPTTTAARMSPPDPAPERSPAAAEVPGRREAPRGFWTEVDSVPERGRAMAEQAAREMGLSLEEYAAVRRRAVELFRKGFLPAHVASELNLTTKQASNWRDRMKGAGLLQFSSAPLIANDTTEDTQGEEQIA